MRSAFIKESEGNNEAGCEGISHIVLADAFVLSSGEIKDVFNKEKESPDDSELQNLRAYLYVLQRVRKLFLQLLTK